MLYRTHVAKSLLEMTRDRQDQGWLTDGFVGDVVYFIELRLFSKAEILFYLVHIPFGCQVLLMVLLILLHVRSRHEH